MKQAFWAPALARLWRLLALAWAAWLLHSAPNRPAPPLSLEDARAFFPTAAQLLPRADGAVAAQDEAGQSLGLLVTTSPESDGIIGYAGPSNLLVALDAGGSTAGIRILESADTPAHVEGLQNGSTFAQSLLGWSPASEPPPKPQWLAGSTLTGLALVEGIAKRFGAKAFSLRFPDPLTLEEARLFFPGAARMAPEQQRPGWYGVTDAAGALLGYVVRTSSASDNITGYAGPTECLVAVAPDRQTLLQIRLRKSYDTDDYVERVVEDRDYLKSLTRWKVAQWPKLDFEAEKIEGVAGATLTSFAVAEGVRQRFRQEGTPPVAAGWRRPGVKDWALWLFCAGAVLLAFSGWRGSRAVRLGWQLLLVGGLGLWLGQFVTLGLLAGWARNGVPWQQAAPLVALAAAALLVPWGARRQLYCHQVCPHGAAQEIFGRISRRTLQLPQRLHRALRLVPGLLLAVAFCGALRWGGFSPGQLEPFDFWVLGWACVLPAVLAVGGLVASFFVPMAYCRYGCPTGALFGFLRTASSQEMFTQRDAAALCVLLAGAFLVYRPTAGAPSPNTSEVRGTGFGTTWCVKTRGTHRSLGAVREKLAAEVERIEAGLSHWRTDSATSRFNRSTSTAPQAVPTELVRLVEFSKRVSRASGGAYDITVAPLVSAWGYGPQGVAAEAPSEDSLRALLPAVGWEKVECGADGASLRKAHPSLSLDLGSVLQGYAVDQLAGLLDAAGFVDYLVEVGGELRARGAWSVAIENPADASKPLARVELRDAALATSGLARARRKLSGAPVSHILSPKTGRPVEPGVELVSVRAATCLEADAWATGLIASGVEEARALARREGLIFWLLDSAGGFAVPETGGSPK
jgi:thiamine biosynthesis lipoprotein ApbE/Na+-translocating ferredoxin:NAD+ oxidoreductase RnfG subunit